MDKRTKNKSLNIFTIPSSQAQLYSQLSLPPTLQHCRGNKNGVWHSAHYTLFLLLLPSQRFSFSDSLWSPSHEPHFFMNCSRTGPLHRVQFFRNRLLQCWFAPQGQKSCQPSCFSLGSPLRLFFISF